MFVASRYGVVAEASDFRHFRPPAMSFECGSAVARSPI
jgi:hypothetical protein